MTILALVVSLLAGPTAAAQGPAMQNARVETARATSIEAAVAEAAAGGDPTWVAWRASMVPGERNLCSTWSSGDTTTRGLLLEELPRDTALPQFTAPPASLRLEAGTSMLVFVRVVEGRVERVRVATDDCPIDGGGRRVLWLAVSPEASTDFLSSLAAPADPSSEAARRIATTSIMAIALHADDSADVALDALLGSTPTADARLAARGQAAQWTARARGRRGFERIVSLLQTERDAAYRRTLVAALAETRDPGTLPALLTIARSDADEQMRAEALFAFARLAPDDELPQVHTLLGSDASETVKRRGVRGLARRPAVASVPLLVALAESSADRVVRTEAVRALGQSRDPAATAFLARLLQ